jgi:hypothetical protein
MVFVALLGTIPALSCAPEQRPTGLPVVVGAGDIAEAKKFGGLVAQLQ